MDNGRVLACLTIAVSMTGLVTWAKGPGPKRSATESVMFLRSGYLEVAIDEVHGQFTMGVPGGPILLYDHPDPWSSFTTIRVDGRDYDNSRQAGNAFGAELQVPLTAGDSNEGIWQVGTTPLRVHQVLTLVAGAGTGRQDTCLVQYTIDNPDSAAHFVGCRVMLDMNLDDKDGAPLRVPGTGSVTTETEWVGGAIPPYFFVFNDLSDAGVAAQATFLGDAAAPTPGKLQIAAWPTIFDWTFDYAVTPGAPVTDDSAYAVYWENAYLAPGQSITFSTRYGLAGIVVDTSPPLVTAMTAPVAMDCRSDVLKPNPFAVSLYAVNSSPEVTTTVTGIQARLILPPGLSLVSEPALQALPDLAPGQDGLLDWTVAADGSKTGTLAYNIDLASAGDGTKTLEGAMDVPAGCSACFIDLTASSSTISGVRPLAVAFTAQGTPTNCSGSPAYDWDFGDGSSHASAQNPSYTYGDAGTYTWTVTASIGSAATSRSGVIAVRSVPPPVVSDIRKAGSPFRFIVTGSNLQSGIAVAINGTPWSGAFWKSDGKIVIKGGSSLKALAPKGTPATFVFTNPDGGSATVSDWAW